MKKENIQRLVPAEKDKVFMTNKETTRQWMQSEVCCCCFGDRDFYSNMRSELERAVCQMIREHGASVFFTACESPFDILFSDVLRDVKENAFHFIHILLVPSYYKEDYLIDREVYQNYYDDILYSCDKPEDGDREKMLRKRDRWLVKNSDYIISAAKHGTVADRAVKYAIYKNKAVVEVPKRLNLSMLRPSLHMNI